MNSQLRALMGDSMIDVAEMMTALRLDKFGEVPFSDDVLRSCASNSVFGLLPIFPFSISYLGNQYPHLFFARGQEAWWKKEGLSFASDAGDGQRWHLIRNKPLLTWSGMQWSMEAMMAQIPAGEQLLPARVLVNTSIIRSLTRGECWLQNFYAPSSDTVNEGRVCVGYNDSGGLDLVTRRDHMPCYKFGLVTEVKDLNTLAAEEAEARRRGGQVPA